VSLLSTESLSVFLSPGELIAVRWRGRPRRIVEKRVYRIAADQGGNWTAAVEALAGVLRETACREIRLTLSCHFTPYQLVPWRDDLDDQEEELAVVRLAFVATYGDAASRWSIRLSDEAPGRPRIAAAIDSDFLAAIEQLAATHKVNLASVRPYLGAAVNHWRNHFGRSRSRWLVLHEKNRVCLALIDHGRWRWVRCVRSNDDWAERLPELVDHEIMLSGTESIATDVLVFAPEHPTLALRSGTRQPFLSLRQEDRSGFSAINDGQFGLAMLGE